MLLLANDAFNHAGGLGVTEVRTIAGEMSLKRIAVAIQLNVRLFLPLMVSWSADVVLTFKPDQAVGAASECNDE
jgi:hypothetical protein